MALLQGKYRQSILIFGMMGLFAGVWAQVDNDVLEVRICSRVNLFNDYLIFCRLRSSFQHPLVLWSCSVFVRTVAALFSWVNQIRLL